MANKNIHSNKIFDGVVLNVYQNVWKAIQDMRIDVVYNRNPTGQRKVSNPVICPLKRKVIMRILCCSQYRFPMGNSTLITYRAQLSIKMLLWNQSYSCEEWASYFFHFYPNTG